MKKGTLYLFSLAVIFAFLASASTTALAAEFYKDKTIRLVVG